MHRVFSRHMYLLSGQSVQKKITMSAGFSIVEGLIAAAILIAALLGTAGAFNLIASSIKGTSDKNSANLAIDRDMSAIKQLAAKYTSCVVPSGSIPAEGDCDVSSNFSAYYFPQNPAPAEQNKFFAACRSSAPGSHITAGLVKAIDGLPEVGSGVTRAAAVREDGSDPQNHNIIILYQRGGSTIRLAKISPVVSAWCG